MIVVLLGPPGCGKTLAAAVIAGELGLPLMRVRVETLFSRYLGETGALLADIFVEMERVRGVYLFDEFDAIARHGDPAAARLPPPGGGFGTPAQCADALRQVGFADCTTQLIRANWRHADTQALVAALQAGTARMAALIEAQPAAAMPAIVADIEQHAAPYRDSAGIAVPTAAVIAAGVKH